MEPADPQLFLTVFAGRPWSCWPPREGWSPGLARLPRRERAPWPHCEYRLLGPSTRKDAQVMQHPALKNDFISLLAGCYRAERQRRSPRPPRSSREYPCPYTRHLRRLQAWQRQNGGLVTARCFICYFLCAN